MKFFKVFALILVKIVGLPSLEACGTSKNMPKKKLQLSCKSLKV